MSNAAAGHNEPYFVQKDAQSICEIVCCRLGKALPILQLQTLRPAAKAIGE